MYFALPIFGIHRNRIESFKCKTIKFRGRACIKDVDMCVCVIFFYFVAFRTLKYNCMSEWKFVVASQRFPFSFFFLWCAGENK